MSSADAHPPPQPPPDDEPPAGQETVEVRGHLPLGQVLSARETTLLGQIREFVAGLPPDAPTTRELARALENGLMSLATLALALQSYPSLRDRQRLGAKDRSLDTLRRTLLEGGEHGLEWSLPTKAVVARAYGIAKVNFLSGLSYGIEVCDGLGAAPILASLRDAMEEAVYTRLAEELYAGFVTSRVTTPQTKDLAVEHLIDLWEGRVRLATDRFCPLLRSAWSARMRAPRVFGTMMGTQEIFTLLFQDCDERFVRWFGQQLEDSEQRQAFEEFLFDLPFENLELVRARMRQDGKACVGPREVERYLGFHEGQLRPLVGDPKGLYTSFRRRRVKAQYRASMGVPGPKRTAEGYLLEALMVEEARSAGPRATPGLS